MSDRTNRLERIRTQILLRQPFLGWMLQKIDLILSPGIQSAATDGLSIFIDPEFIDSIGDTEMTFLLLHELLHVLLLHPSRAKGRNKVPYNIACDIVVNDTLIHYGFSCGELKPIRGERYDLDGSRYSVEEVYERIPKAKNPVLLDLHGFWVGSVSRSIRSKDIIDRWVREASQEGWTPKDDFLFRTLVKSGMPVRVHLHWIAILESYLTKIAPDYTYQRTDRRFQDILIPDFIAEESSLEQVWFVIDASMSITEDVLYSMYAQIKHLFRRFPSVRCHLSFFSTIVNEPVSIENQDSIEAGFRRIGTTGGTSFHVIFQAMRRYFPVELPKLVVVMTDGCARFPDKDMAFGVPVIWLIYRNTIEAPFGRTVTIDE